MIDIPQCFAYVLQGSCFDDVLTEKIPYVIPKKCRLHFIDMYVP